ncbi:MAG: porin family protein [bacterium]|nr:porin family protein [bacterium]
MKWIIWVLFLLSGMIASGYAAEQSTMRNLGVGFQATYPNVGMSVRYNFHPIVGVQGVVGAFGDVYTAGARVNLIRHRQNHQAMFYGSFGTFQYKREIDPYMNYYRSSTNAAGLGFGVEWFIRKIPELGLGLEVGFFRKEDRYSNHSISISTSMTVGAAVHYYFE